MPLHVYININRQSLEELHIGRLEGGTNPDDINTYAAVLGAEPLYLDEWLDKGVEYQHRYGDGALVCVRKALEALEMKDAPIQLKVNLDKAGHVCEYDFQIWKRTSVCRCGAVALNPFYIAKDDHV